MAFYATKDRRHPLMRFRKLLATLSAAVLITVLALPTTLALADGYVTVSSSVTPAALSGDGNVTLNVTVTNSADNPNSMKDVKVQRNGVTVLSYDDTNGIQPSAIVTLTGPLKVTAAELGQQIPLTLTWTENGVAQPALTTSVTVASNATAQPSVDFTRTLSDTTAVAGDTVTLTYSLKNTGAVDLTNVKIEDSGVSGMSKTYSTVAAGSSVEFSYDMTINADFTSTPKLTYTANGQNYTKTLPDKTVQLTQAQLDAVLDISPDTVASGGEVTLLCTLTNSGNVQLNNIVVSDDTLGSKLYTLSKLAPGAKKSFSKTLTLTETTSFQYTIKAKDANGHDVSFQSNKANATVQSDQTQNLNLEILANCNTLQLTEPGNVSFDISVTNKGDTAVNNVKITDQDGNPITVIDSLPPGTKSIPPYKTVVNETTVFSFTAAVDGDNGEYKVSSGPVQVNVVQPTASETPSVAPTDDLSTASADATDVAAPAASSGRLGTLLLLLGIVGVLIVITAVALVVMIIKERRRSH